jgi:hypothetical protein
VLTGSVISRLSLLDDDSCSKSLDTNVNCTVSSREMPLQFSPPKARYSGCHPPAMMIRTSSCLGSGLALTADKATRSSWCSQHGPEYEPPVLQLFGDFCFWICTSTWRVSKEGARWTLDITTTRRKSVDDGINGMPDICAAVVANYSRRLKIIARPS